jgi:hypothetical protein
MKTLIVLIVSLSVSAAWSDEQTMRLDISPAAVRVGQAAVLSWEVVDAEGIYLSSIGEVAASGEALLRPFEPTVYSLIVDNVDSVLTLSVVVRVEGIKDGVEPECPRDHMFRFPYTYRTGRVRYTQLLSVFHEVLQDSMDFCILSEYKPQRGPFRFLTACSERSYLVDDDEKTIGARRLAYLVEIQEPDRSDSVIEYTVMPAIQYRKRIVRTWRLETADRLYVREAKRLDARIRRALEKRAEKQQG